MVVKTVKNNNIIIINTKIYVKLVRYRLWTVHVQMNSDCQQTISDPPCPSSTAEIGRPDFKLEVSGDKKKTTLYVTDPLTAVFKDGRQLNIRDIFSDELQYKVTYRRNKSTGKVSNSRCRNINLEYT